MKKAFLSLAFIALAISSQAQSVTGSLKELAQEGKAKLEFDYTSASIHGQSEKDFCRLFEHNYFKDKHEVLQMFTEHFTQNLGSTMTCSPNVKSPFTIVVKVLDVNKKGNTKCELHVMKKDANGTQKEVATVTGLNKRGGTYGSAMNLMKDGAKHVGNAAGSFMKKNLQKALN